MPVSAERAEVPPRAAMALESSSEAGGTAA